MLARARARVCAMGLICCAAMTAQNVFPKGMGSIGGTTNGRIWDAEKGRLVILIDKAQFPWGAGAPGSFAGFALRRSPNLGNDMIGGSKTVRVRLSATRSPTSAASSTPIGPTAAMVNASVTAAPQATVVLDSNHGSATPTAMTLTSSSVFFPFAPAPPTFYQSFGMTFSHAVRFTSPFTVPSDADTLVVDVEIENLGGNVQDGYVTDATDSVVNLGSSGPAVREYVGSIRAVSAPCTATLDCSDGIRTQPCMYQCKAKEMYPGGAFTTDLRVGIGNAPVLSWIGLMLPAPVSLIAYSCDYQVAASAVHLTRSGPFDTKVEHTWGTLPNRADIVGLQFGVQFAAIEPNLHPQGVATSRAFEVTVGPAPTGEIQFTTVAADCDGTCGVANDPFAAGALGRAAPTPILLML